MNVEEKLVLVEKYLKKNRESNVVELIVKDYDDCNFYLSLVFNSRIEKFKVLFIPLDNMDTKRVEDYTCYQFIQLPLVNYILETIWGSKKKYVKSSFRDKTNKNVSSYYVEINTHVSGEDFTFKTTQYIPKEWMFFYEIISLLFQHAPAIVSGFGNSLLDVLNDSTEMVEYKASFKCDLFNVDLDNLFKEKFYVSGEEDDVSFLEKVNGKYYAIVKEHIVIVDYNNFNHILNLYCDCSKPLPDSHILSVLKAIVKGKERKFYKLVVTDNKDNFIDNTGKFKYYLCYGMNDKGLKVIDSAKSKVLSYSMIYEGLVKIIFDIAGELEKEIKHKLEGLYDKAEVNSVMKNIEGVFPN